MVHTWSGYKFASDGHIEIQLPKPKSGYSYTNYGIFSITSSFSSGIANLIIWKTSIDSNYIARIYYCTGSGSTANLTGSTIYAGFLFLANKEIY